MPADVTPPLRQAISRDVASNFAIRAVVEIS
jgi:hypothetical protein